MSINWKLRYLRECRGITQAELARTSGIGLKTISSFESGSRLDSMKISQLRRLLAALDCNESEFFSGEHSPDWVPSPAVRAFRALSELPPYVQRSILSSFEEMVETARMPPPSRPMQSFLTDWELLTSRN